MSDDVDFDKYRSWTTDGVDLYDLVDRLMVLISFFQQIKRDGVDLTSLCQDNGNTKLSLHHSSSHGDVGAKG